MEYDENTRAMLAHLPELTIKIVPGPTAEDDARDFPAMYEQIRQERAARKGWAEKLRKGADSVDNLVKQGAWPKHALEAVLARMFSEPHDLRHLADLLTPESEGA